ncbi:MAG: hypothetical protein EXX96DRAFT_537123 [Benjaminiella poitrasii]|nr:MAG: hypothetical protein EXX96DRAFT_537123 [Benjaminiella poitrasii]
MSFDWKQCEKIIKQKNDSLLIIIQYHDHLRTFFTMLLKALRQLKTVTACAQKFAHIGPLLTASATHAYIGYDPNIASLVLACLIEYTKLDPDAFDDRTVLSIENPRHKSIDWCIIRLRRFIHVAYNVSDTHDLVQRITQRISDSDLSIQKIRRLADMSLALVHEKEAWPLIEKLVVRALDHTPLDMVDPVHFTKPERILSDQFLYHLANPHSALRPLYQQWQPDIKARLYINYEEILEIEILDIVKKYTDLQTNCYEPLDHLYRSMLENEDLIQVLISHPVLIDPFFDKFFVHLTQFNDWRFIRLSQCFVLCLLSNTHDSHYSSLVQFLTSHEWQEDVNDVVKDFIYGGSSETMVARRNAAWCLSLTSLPFLYCCVSGLVEWHQQRTEPWTTKMEQRLAYVNWIIYPSMDARQSESLADLQSWIQQTDCDLYDDLPKYWH